MVLRRLNSLSDTKTKRTPVEILAEILEICRKQTAKTQIMYKTNISFSGMQKSLKHLQKLGLLRLDDDAKKYLTTEKGFEFIRRYAALQDLLG